MNTSLEALEKQIKTDLEKAKFSHSSAPTEQNYEHLEDMKKVHQALYSFKFEASPIENDIFREMCENAVKVFEENEGWKAGRSHDDATTRLNLYQKDYEDEKEDYNYIDLIPIYSDTNFDMIKSLETLAIYWFTREGYELHNKTYESIGPEPSKDAKNHFVYLTITK